MPRKTITLEVDNDGQETLVRSYHALVLEMGDLAQSAPPGKVLDQLEELALEKGRETLRATPAQAVQARVDAAEKKGRRRGNARVVRSARTAAPRREPSGLAWVLCPCHATGGASAVRAPSRGATTPMPWWDWRGI